MLIKFVLFSASIGQCRSPQSGCDPGRPVRPVLLDDTRGRPGRDRFRPGWIRCLDQGCPAGHEGESWDVCGHGEGLASRDFRFRCGGLYFALTLSAYNTKCSVNLGSVDSRKNLFTHNKTFLEVNVAQYQPRTQAIGVTIRI